MEKVIYDSHMHTPLSMHSTGWPVDYAKVAIEKNFKGICFTDHAPVVKYPWVQDFWTIPERIFDSYFSLIKFTKEYIGDALDIRLGVEVDFVHNNQDMDYLRSIINYAPYDIYFRERACYKAVFMG
ncbi:MAG: PHP domain-containing protein [Bdellovibrionota bacterium]